MAQSYNNYTYTVTHIRSFNNGRSIDNDDMNFRKYIDAIHLRNNFLW